MRNRRVLFLFIFALAHALITKAAIDDAATDPIFDIPKLTGISLEKCGSDWHDSGFRFDTMTRASGVPYGGKLDPPNARLAWDSRGLLILIRVHDTTPFENSYIRHLFLGDSVEVFVSRGRGSTDRYMLVASPGLDPKYPTTRHCFFYDPSQEEFKDASQLKCDIECQKATDGYTMEMLLPWSNLQINPTLEEELGFQLYVMDADSKGNIVTSMCQPFGESHLDPNAVFRIRLADMPSSPFNAEATTQEQPGRHSVSVRLVAEPSTVGRIFEVDADDTVFRGVLSAAGKQAAAVVDLPKAASYRVSIADEAVPVIKLPTADLQTTVTQMSCSFDTDVFADGTFPSPNLNNAGTFRIQSITFLDQGYNVVSSASKPGRYGAVIEIAASDGHIFRRFRTLCRVPQKIGDWNCGNGTTADLIDLSQIIERPGSEITFGSQGLAWLKANTSRQDPRTPALLAYLCEQPSALHDPDIQYLSSVADRQWWLNYKRRVYGFDKIYPSPFVDPISLQSSPSPVIHSGTLEDAGVKAAAVAEIDRICEDGEQTSHEPVALILARHGVVFFDKGYGQADGRTMTTSTVCDIYSQTKTISGALMMMIVDKGQVSLDGTVDQYLPSVGASATKAQTVSIRRLYDHTSGLRGAWGDAEHDTEEVIAGFYPSLRPGAFIYNGVGAALGTKIVEEISGEPLPVFCQNHLFGPLGMHSTRVEAAAAGGLSTAMDMAKFGQMLLNKGSYGQLDFFNPSTFQMMLPPHGSGHNEMRGIGTMQAPAYAPPSVFGHGATHSGMFWIDPKEDLVIILTSRGKEKLFSVYEKEIFGAIYSGLN